MQFSKVRDGDILILKKPEIYFVYKTSPTHLSLRKRGMVGLSCDIVTKEDFEEKFEPVFKPLKRRRTMAEMKDVNPEGIRGDDFISTRSGVALVIHVDEERGHLSYKSVGEEIMTEDIPIRNVRLLATKRDPRQLNFPFIEKHIEDCISERNMRLSTLKNDFVAKKAREPRKPKTGIRPTDKDLKVLLTKLDPKTLATLLK